MDAQTPAAMLAAIPPDVKPVTHDVTITTTRKLAQAKVLGVPPEEFGIERGARNIKDCNYCFHETEKTVGSLVDQGYDEKQLNNLISSGTNNSEALARDTVWEESPRGDTLNKTARLVRVTEHYIRMNYKGDGRPCLYMVVTAGEGGEILRKDGADAIFPIDVIPFATTTPIPIPHRFFGRSVADVVMPAQREKTALKRGALDNLYLHNNMRVEVAESHAGPNTLDDLLVSRPGGVVRTKQPGGVQWQVVPDITGSVFPALQYLDAEIEARTGLTKQTQGIDANALQNQSATAVAQVFSASQMRLKLIARNFAEGVRDIFSLLHHTIRSHGKEQKKTVRLRNTWVPVDPSNWKTRNDMTINVGLGTGGKAQQFAQQMALLNIQKELVLGGKAHLVGDTELFNNVADIAKIMGHKNPDKYINDPSAKDPKTGQPLHPPQPPPPDPAIVKAQMDQQTKQQELAMREKETVANAEIARQADERKAQIESVQAQADIATQDRKTQAEMQLAQQKFELERELKIMDFQLKREMQAAELEMKREQHQQALQAGAFKVAAGAEAHQQKMEQSASKEPA